MLMLYRTAVPLLLLTLLAACTSQQRETQLAQRETALLQKEKNFALKEAEYKALLKMRDSLLAVKDSAAVKVWPAAIAGRWNGRVLCTESNCKDYVIGDVRTDSWEFLADSTGLYANIVNNSKIVRVLHGNISNEQVLLSFRTDSSVSKMVEIQVSLNTGDSTLMKGTQVVKAENDCTAKFSVELSRAAKIN